MNTEVKQRTEAEHLFADLDKPSLHGLSYALRHPDTWPNGFVWNYKRCQSCAIGLAHQLWNSIPSTGDPRTGATIMARSFAMPYGASENIFLGKGPWCPRKTWTKIEGFLWWKKRVQRSQDDFDAVTPEMVADQIDKYLATVE